MNNRDEQMKVLLPHCGKERVWCGITFQYVTGRHHSVPHSASPVDEDFAPRSTTRLWCALFISQDRETMTRSTRECTQDRIFIKENEIMMKRSDFRNRTGEEHRYNITRTVCQLLSIDGSRFQRSQFFCCDGHDLDSNSKGKSEGNA
jgi:hypothetical protein